MMDELNFIKLKETENIIARNVPNKERYYLDLLNIENSFTGRSDAIFSNTFFRESAQLIVNAIALYEMGYFDCAFYSLRQSLELSTTVVYFVDDDIDNRKVSLNKWKNQERFPQQGEMLNQLKNRKIVFAEIKDKLSSFFAEIEVAKNIMNKYVHKQGFEKFYVYRFKTLEDSIDAKMLLDFEQCLKKCMGGITIFRLTIDPMPLLLNDDNIFKRTGQLMTDPFSVDFLERYVEKKYIDSYKETKLYKEHYDAFIENEEMLPAVVDFIKFDYLDRDKISDIVKQAHLLSQPQLVAVMLFCFSVKISKIYSANGFIIFFCNTESSRNRRGWSSKDFKRFTSDKAQYNVKYDEAFLTSYIKNGEVYCIEHIEKFNEEEIYELKNLGKDVDI